MNGSWSDQDLSQGSDLTVPDSQSGTSEFDSSEDGHHRLQEDNGDFEGQSANGSEADSDGPRENQDQSTEGDEGEDDDDDVGYNSAGHRQPEVVGEQEAEGSPAGRRLGEAVEGGEPVASEQRQTVINMHHVDLILDNIDAELNDIINRSLNSEHSEPSYHDNGSSSGASSQKASAVTRREPASSDSAADDTLNDDSAPDTGLGTGSHRGDSSPIPDGVHARRRSAGGKGQGTRLKDGGSSRSSAKKRVSRRQALVEFSDIDSICSDEVRMRMEETLNLQDSDTDARHSHNPSPSHHALPKHDRSLPPSATASSRNRGNGVPYGANESKSEASSQSEDNHETQEISSRIQEMVSLVLSDSTTDPLFEEAPSSPNLGNSHQSQSLPRTTHNAQQTTGLKTSSNTGQAHQPLAPNSRSFLEYQRAGRGVDAESIATEDFEQVFQKSIVTPTTVSNGSPMKRALNKLSNRDQVKSIPSASPKKTDHLTVPGTGKRGKSRSKKKRTNTLPASKPSGLPEYMYLRKGVTESDVGSDSIRTEEYEGHFEVARVVDHHNPPNYANLSRLPRRSHVINVQSDPESIQTEEYEQRFCSLMVKQVAGVPVKSFDQVTIASDLESVETGMVHEKFQEALRKGPEVRVFNEFGDQSYLDPLQVEEVERKFQAILRKKKIENMRHSQKDGVAEDEDTSDVDSVRAMPSKSETGSPPDRKSRNGRSKDHRHHNGVHVRHPGHSRDAATRNAAHNPARSGPQGLPGSPALSHPTSPGARHAPRDVSPSLPQWSPKAAVTMAVSAATVPKSCGNHPDKNPARAEQANFPSWQDPSVGHQRAATWNSQRQDSFSTYEEVESLNSHQCSSLQSLDNSCGPSRLQSFGSTSSSIDQCHPQVDGRPWPGGIRADNHPYDHQQDDQASSLTSESTQSASAEGGKAGHLKEKSRRSLIEDDEDEMNSSVAKWVDQTRAETARRRSYVGLPEDPLVRSHEAPEGGKQSCDRNKETSLTALKMQCGDVIPGKSGRRMRLPNETDLELALRVGNSSPVNVISRGASLDSSPGSAGSDHPEGDWTIAEDVLINLGFGGVNMGIPNRFLKSWRDQVVKQRVEEVRRLLGNTTSSHLLQHLPTKPEKTPSLKEKCFFPRKEERHNHNLPSSANCSPRSSSTSPLASESSNSHQGEDAVMSRQRGADKAKLVGLRRSLKKAATVSSFGQTLSEINNTRQGPPNQQVLNLQQGDQSSAARRSPGGGKYSPFHKNHKSSARDRRRKYMKKQSSLPISLETLQEEDESLKPGLIKSKPADTESRSARKNPLKPQSLEVGDQPAFHCKLKIVMEQPSVESREAMSRQGTTDVGVDEAIADVDTDKKDQKVSMEQYLVVKAIIESKDSGFENEPSRAGSPQISPRSSEDETVRASHSQTISTAYSNASRTRSAGIPDSRTDSVLVNVPSKEISDISRANPSTCPIKSFKEQHTKQEQSPKREERPTTESKSTSETSRSTTVLIPQTGDTKLYGRSSSTSSNRRGSASAEEFLHAIADEDNDVFDSPVGDHISEMVSASCQTSPTLHSPLLSPLFFLAPISEHPDLSLSDDNNSATNVSPDTFVLPSGSASDVGNDKGVSAERHDSLESVKTTADGLFLDASPRSLSQEISDGGLSIIAEKDEEQGFGQEPSDRVSVMEKAIQGSQELLSPLARIKRSSSTSGHNHFRFDNLLEHAEPVDATTSNPVEKSRNPFKSSECFYSSPRHSKVDFDFDATIEEDEDGEQYSDGESFSKVSFPELTAMVYQAPTHVNASAFVNLDHNSKESHNSSPRLSKDDGGPERPCSLLKETDFKSGISSESTGNKSGAAAVDPIDLWHNGMQDGPNSGQTGLDQPILEIDVLNKGVDDDGAPTISVIDGKKNEDNFTSCEQSSASYQPANCHGSCEDRSSLRTDELTEDTVSVDCPGDRSQFFGSGQAVFDNEDSMDNPDKDIAPGEISKMTDFELDAGSNQSDKANVVSEVKDSAVALLDQTDRHTEFLDRMHLERHGMEHWKLGVDQPQILRSTSVEAHLSVQRRKLRTLSERSTLYCDGMEPLLSGFACAVTDHSSSSTEGFGSFGSDVFRRPLTTAQTLQQVAAKLESHIRQRGLVSIQDDESGEENEPGLAEGSQTSRQQTVPEVRKPADVDSTEKLKFAQPNQSGNLQEDEGFKELNSRDEINIADHSVDKSPTDTHKIAEVCEKEVPNNSDLFEEHVQHYNNTIVTSESADGLEVETDVINTNFHVDETCDSKLLGELHIQNMSAASHKNCTGANKDTPSATTMAVQRSWQFQAPAPQKASNFLSVPSFGPLAESISGSPLPPSQSAQQVNSDVESLPEVSSEPEHDHDSDRIIVADGEMFGCQSLSSDKTNSPQVKQFEASRKITMERTFDGNEPEGKDISTCGLCTGTETSFNECEVPTWTPIIEQNPSYPTILYSTYSGASNLQNERELPKSTTDCVHITLSPSNDPRENTVLHSQYFRCEKFVNVSTSSDGQVDFTETSEEGNLCGSTPLPTFLSEAKFPALSGARKGVYPRPAESRMAICSQGSHCLDCPSPVLASRLSPTFEEICTKAGDLMQQLQKALAGVSRDDLHGLQAEIENEDMDKELHEVLWHVEAEEGRFTRLNGHRHLDDAPRMRQENKRKKKRPTRGHDMKTSTPKAKPNSQYLGDDRRDQEGNVGGGSRNDHQATIRELVETEAKMRRKLDELESSFEEVSSRKQDALGDLKMLREAVHRNKRDIQKAEEIARENMERADGLRSELMVLEYQRDQSRRDLEDLTRSLGSFKQSHGHGVSDEENGCTGNDLLPLSPKEVIAVIKERDDLKTRLRNGEGDLSPMERSELERQLNFTKQELFNGQKSSREKLEFLEEELEESRHIMEELLVEKTNLGERVKELQAIVGSEHGGEVHSHVEERNQLLEQLRSKLQQELDSVRHQHRERDQRLESLTAAASERDALNSALRDKIAAMQQEAREERQEAERRVIEAEGRVRNADVAKELALVELRESLLGEKEEEMVQLKMSLEKDKKEALTALDEKTSEMMTITQRSLAEKEEDLKAVKLQLVQQTEEANKMEQQLREQAEEETRAAVDKERRERVEEYARRRKEEAVEKELEVAKETSRLQGELLVTKQRLEHLQTTVGVLKEEMDKLREENLAAGREKVEAVSDAREKAREDIQRELDQLREQLAKENLLEVDRLRLKIRQQEEELDKLRSEVKVHQDKEARSAGVTGSKSILAEINEECKRTAAVIGSTPVKINISSTRASKSLNGTLSPRGPLHSTPDPAHGPAHGPGRTQVMAALTNLRISNEELRSHAQTLKTDLERQKRALSKAQKEKDEEVKRVANAIEKKSGDMDTMRDRLIQDHLAQVEDLQQQVTRQRTSESALQQRLLDKDSELREIQQSMTQWKEETALKMAKKFEEELGKELEIRLQETGKRDGSSYRSSQSDRGSRSSSGNGSPSIVSSASDASTVRLLRHLQERVKQLRTENLSLRRSSRGPLESSGEERASPHSSRNSESEDKDHLLYQMQQRVKLLERQLQVAEERCRENAASASEKMSENGRLQSALTQQTKELMKMERAYSKLGSPARTPVRL